MGIYIIKEKDLIKKVFQKIQRNKCSFLRGVMTDVDLGRILDSLDAVKKDGRANDDFASCCQGINIRLNRVVKDLGMIPPPITPEEVTDLLQSADELGERNYYRLLSLALVSTWLMFKSRS